MGPGTRVVRGEDSTSLKPTELPSPPKFGGSLGWHHLIVHQPLLSLNKPIGYYTPYCYTVPALFISLSLLTEFTIKIPRHWWIAADLVTPLSLFFIFVSFLRWFTAKTGRLFYLRRDTRVYNAAESSSVNSIADRRYYWHDTLFIGDIEEISELYRDSCTEIEKYFFF